jgi:transcriptional regulator with XRE-family HTH domain
MLRATSMQTVAKWVAAKRYSLREFGALCGISRAYAGQLLRGQAAPSVQVLRVIHEVTEIDCETLLYECTRKPPSRVGPFMPAVYPR